MHSYKTRKKNLSSNTHQTEHVQNYSTRKSYQEIRGGDTGRKGEDRIKQPFYTIQRINPLGSTVSVTSMHY
ncbi:unnamed protein product [Staurois parvus]|uniref:Uncharacterized protein n=1 Tax=Staurois parvus TaxID=386267 RepID=A0ABN9AKL2_9NEOB|nr:unnamed protein product [Staurois parvus]